MPRSDVARLLAGPLQAALGASATLLSFAVLMLAAALVRLQAVAARPLAGASQPMASRADDDQLRRNASVGCLRLLHCAKTRLILERVEPVHRAADRLHCLCLGEVLVNLATAN
jgi:hypothetical protein